MWAIIIIGIIFFIVIAFIQTKANSEKIKGKCAELKEKLTSTGFHIDKTIALYGYADPEDSTIVSYTEDAPKFEIFFDVTNKKFAFSNYTNELLKYFDFSSVIDCEIIEDNTTIMKGGIGRAVAGGILAGGVGALVGAGTRKSSDIVKIFQVKIIFDNILEPLFTIELITQNTKRDSVKYKNCFTFAQKVHATMVSIINQNEKMSQI